MEIGACAGVLAVAAFAGFFVMASVFAAAQGGPPGGGESLPSGISALAPSPPAGAPPDAASVARGTVLYETRLNCAPCHGLTGRGGPNNSPDLTRSALAMQPDGGRGLAAFLRLGRPEQGMPPIAGPLTDQEAADLSAKVRSLGFAAVQRTGRGSWRWWPRRRSGAPACALRSTVVDSCRRSEARQTLFRGADL